MEDSFLKLSELTGLTISVVGVGRLEPKDDVTPLEAVHLMMMLTAGGSLGRGVDFVKFVSDHKLERHFNRTALGKAI